MYTPILPQSIRRDVQAESENGWAEEIPFLRVVPVKPCTMTSLEERELTQAGD
jgi:hypothetical protein